MKKRGLGRSLNAILSSGVSHPPVLDPIVEDNATHSPLQNLSVTQIVPGKYQPRRDIDEEAINELALSIKAQGVLQPIIVRKKDEKFEIIAGERRWRASQKAGLKEVPVIIKDIPDETAMAIGLIENIQRENLNAIDEACGLQRLLQEFSLTHQEIADAIGRSRASVSNLLRLLNLPAAVQKYLQHGDLEMGHARALLALPAEQQLRAAEHVVEQALSVRETEHYIKQLQVLNVARTQVKTSPSKSAQILQMQQQFSEALKMKVVIQQDTQGKGKVVIAFDSARALEELLDVVKKG